MSNTEFVSGRRVGDDVTKKSSSRTYLGLGFCIGLLIGLALFFGLYFGLPTNCSDETTDAVTEPLPSYAEFSDFAVATDAPECSTVGREILEKGGHAVDAAIAAMLCAGLYNMHSSGIGGGCFITIYDAPTDEVIFINAREVAPLNASENMFQGNSELSQRGTMAIAVPGEIAGYWEAHKRYGKLPWADLFEPAIKLAADGLHLRAAVASSMQEQYITNETFNLAPILTLPNGSMKSEGDLVVRPQLAYVLRKIAEGGADEFYNGTLAEMIVDDIQDGIGSSTITLEDFRQYRAEIRESLKVDINGKYTVYSPPPTGSGAVLCYILNILEGYKFTPDDLKNNEVLVDHLIVEAFKFAYAKRTELGDDRYDEGIKELTQNMTSEWFAAETRAKITNDSTHETSYYGAVWAQPPNDHGTSHLSVLSKDGSAVSMTSTINLWFGSKVRGYRTGIIFNNEMDDFSSPNITNAFGVPPSPSNFIAPGKRPLSSMTPTIITSNDVTDTSKKVRMISGASGGTKITTGTALSILNHLWFEEKLDDSVARLRLHHQLAPEYIQYEKGFDEAVLEGLKTKGHDIESFNPPGSVVQAIARLPNGKIASVSDKRKAGAPDGQ